MRRKSAEFTPEMDEKLKWCVVQEKYRTVKSKEGSPDQIVIAWRRIAKEHFPTHNFSTQKLYQRFARCLNPLLQHGPWTQDEDALLLQLYEKYGAKWSKIGEELKTRCDVWCRQRYKKLTGKSKASTPKRKKRNSDDNSDDYDEEEEADEDDIDEDGGDQDFANGQEENSAMQDAQDQNVQNEQEQEDGDENDDDKNDSTYTDTKSSASPQGIVKQNRTRKLRRPRKSAISVLLTAAENVE